MTRRHGLIAALLAPLAFAAPASAAGDGKAEGGKAACFHSGNITGWSYVDRDTVRITVGVRDQYDLTLFSPQPDLNFRHGIGIRTRGSSWVCSPMDIQVVGDRFAGRVPVKAITPVPRADKKDEGTKEERPAG